MSTNESPAEILMRTQVGKPLLGYFEKWHLPVPQSNDPLQLAESLVGTIFNQEAPHLPSYLTRVPHSPEGEKLRKTHCIDTALCKDVRTALIAELGVTLPQSSLNNAL